MDVSDPGRCGRTQAEEPLTRETSGTPYGWGRDQVCLQELSYLGRVLKPLRKHSWGEGKTPSKSVEKPHNELDSTGIN